MVREGAEMASYLNLCRSCDQDFNSVGTFDRHRVGKHEFTYHEGLEMDPPREDGRRCLSVDEMLERGWSKDARGRWRTKRREGPFPPRPATRTRGEDSGGTP